MIRSLGGSLPAAEAAVWEDELDVHLNPRVGPDWTLPGTQRVVMTPGRWTRRPAGWYGWPGGRQDSRLFLELLKRLLKEYPGRRVIHGILDNYAIHSSKRTRLCLAEHGQRFRLHLLPP